MNLSETTYRKPKWLFDKRNHSFHKAHNKANTSDLFDLVPGLLPLLYLALGFIQFSEEPADVCAAGADRARSKAAEHWRRAGREAATHKVPYTPCSAIQT